MAVIFDSIGWKVFFLSMPLYASFGEGMPWEEPLTKIANSLSGPVARAAGVIAIAGAGLALAMGESGGFFRKMIQVVFGLAIAFSAATWGLGFLGYGSGALVL
ncbi:MAG: TrbC/VirB2 family protein [Deltaproteobacteria bacterium]|nr:TrbC/VirB2 family protein [Deltaproteobacteria bacterium]